MHIALDMGHNCPPDVGVNAIKFEDALTHQLGMKLIALLVKEGIKITVVNPNRAKSVTHSLHQRCYAANISGADYYVSLHFNASDGRGHGSEVFAISPRGKALGSAILPRICALGFRNRGVKDGRKYYVIRHTSMPAVIVEGAFADNKEDMERLDLDQMAIAISQGILQMRNQPSSFNPGTEEIT